MIELNKPGGDEFLEQNRVAGAQNEKLSLTQLWEVIVRKKRLPDGLDAEALYAGVRERLRDPEREVRQHALRVLVDLIPVTGSLDEHMKGLVPELLLNLGHSAPALRKSALDSLRRYLRHGGDNEELLMELLASDEDNVVGAVAFLVGPETRGETLARVVDRLWQNLTNPRLSQETVAKSLARIRYVLGDERFKSLVGLPRYEELQKICDNYGLPIDYSDADSDGDRSFSNGDSSDRVILETEITLKTGPAITMKIHEESRSNSASGDSEEEMRRDAGVVKVLGEDSESDFYDSSRRTPRKVRFGGECVKMRTPESEGSQQEEEDEIRITVTDAVSIRTRRSLIPVRITSLPSTPKRGHPSKRRLHGSTPNLSFAGGKSRIPLRKDSVASSRISKDKDNAEKPTTASIPAPQPVSPTPSVNRKLSRSEDSLTPFPIHNEIEVLHNLTRSPERKQKPSQEEQTTNDSFQIYPEEPAPENNEETQRNDYDSFQMFPEDQSIVSPQMDSVQESGEKTFSSFQVCTQEEMAPVLTAPASLPVAISTREYGNGMESEKESPHGESFTKVQQEEGSFEQQYDISSFSTEDNFWNKSEALDNLLNMLKQPNTCETLEPGPASLLFEALFACQHLDKLHYLADDALKLMIKGLREEVLERCLGRLAMGICKVGAPSGVSLALMIMKKCPAKKLQVEIVERCMSHRTREGALQVLMATARLLPSSDVEMTRIAEFAAAALRDRRRKVRHAALETLATLAQIGSNADVLEMVSRTTASFQDHQHLMRVVRTRLSRRQLPTVELDGTVRYSSPREQTELDWLSGSNQVSSTPSSSASSSNHSVNYWIHNSRHDGNRPEEYLRSMSQDDSVNGGQQIWAVDPTMLAKVGNAKNSNSKGRPIFRPIYVLQPEPIGVRGHRRFDRGRSFSPPKHYPRSYQDAAIPQDPPASSSNRRQHHHQQHHTHASGIPRKFILNEGFRKSFSSEQLYVERPPVLNENYFSLSSRSSTTSTGSSTKSGLWQRDIRSGIPVPIPSETKLRIRTHHSHTNSSTGPVIARRSVLSSPSEPPAITRLSPGEDDDGEEPSPQVLLPPAPASSGSESSGYFTPPRTESRHAFVKLDTEDRPSESDDRDAQNDKNNNSEDCVDSFNNNPVKEFVVDDKLQGREALTSPSSAGISDITEEINDNKTDNLSLQSVVSEDTKPLRFSAPILKDQTINDNVIVKTKSKSVVDLQNFLPDIAGNNRKSALSAPPLKDDTNLLITNYDETPISASRVNLAETEPPLELEADTTIVEITTTTRKLTRRISRTQSKRSSVKSTPRSVQETTPKSSRSVGRPKETLQQALAQLNNPEWEVMILGLQSLSKVTKNHPDVVEAQMHTVCVNLARHIKNLRSQVARAACHTTSEMFAYCRKGLEMELEEIAGPLLHRTADTNKFLRADANEALDVMCEHLPPHRLISVITTRGCNHQNAVVRSASIRLIGDIVKRIGAEKVFQFQREVRDKIILTGANALTDGSPEARGHGKGLISQLIGHPNFQRILVEVVPQSTIRHIAKTLSTIKPNAKT